MTTQAEHDARRRSLRFVNACPPPPDEDDDGFVHHWDERIAQNADD